VIFTALWLYFRAKGGYRAVSISEPADTPASQVSRSFQSA
jgi:hypothetical protein